MTLESVDETKTPQDPDLHVLLSGQYVRIWEARNIEEFKQTFLDCVECHYRAYATGGILHRGISEDSLMIHRSFSNLDVEGPTREDGKSTRPISGPAQEGSIIPPCIGRLNDFDMAAKVNNQGQFLVTSASHRTGTLPFMALDLLKPGKRVLHVYRHDLESFFYILVWAAVHYDLKHGKRKSCSPKVLQSWLNESTCFLSKHRFMSDSLAENDSIQQHIPDDAKRQIWDEWVVPLHILFKGAFVHRSTQADKHLPVDHETLDGLITFETFMRAVRVKPRGLDGLK
ncbi:hypothetical protein CVT26_006571 [Gymnopilus dilepis]|uniref:Fungal-type protein kinase domain-containing protein n=1 Tax=Gymnopilus dilepis TaxID=231916 RepID=A0A409Y2U5_9AGAR|nr:hypothetical protein CVT26_006571 [Gymnopilus dilepis]